MIFFVSDNKMFNISLTEDIWLLWLKTWPLKNLPWKWARKLKGWLVCSHWHTVRKNNCPKKAIYAQGCQKTDGKTNHPTQQTSSIHPGEVRCVIQHLMLSVWASPGVMDALDPLNQTSNNLVEAPKEVKAWDTGQEFPKKVHKGAQWVLMHVSLECQLFD